MAGLKSSVLVFEMSKKTLFYKILSRELKNHLRAEIWKNFGARYVKEKSEQSTEFYSSPVPGSDETAPLHNNSTGSSATNFNLTDDLIYEYFSVLVASYEISKELNYVYEYALFDRNKYIIRFQLYKNFLIMILFNMPGSGLATDMDLKNQLYVEFYSNWFLKSIISLFKYKFGISTDYRCFKDTADENVTEIKSLFSKWTHFYQTENVYFIEAIEKLEVNKLNLIFSYE